MVHLVKIKKRINNLKETEDSRYIYQNELDTACSQHDMAYGGLKDLNRKTATDIVSRDKAFNNAKNPKYGWCKRGIASMIYNCFDKEISGGTIKNEIILNKELAEELHKLIVRNFNKRKVHSPFIDNIWGADLADMQLIIKFNKGFRFLLYVIDTFSKYAWVISLKFKKRNYIY